MGVSVSQGPQAIFRQTLIAIERGKYIPSAMLVLPLACYFLQPVKELLEVESPQMRTSLADFFWDLRSSRKAFQSKIEDRTFIC
ncbi:DNA-binding XRE family transcriptional regulator [Spirosoma sp. LMG 31448]|uniref:DNA-binding XRE family transcriptional regulator n=1 Tax=Spirosoma utsteinense TaxID=2585773 RepID=A0ABR6WAD5_9BACT|nr:DNA-binding XRE family transcriptional regulator [Spirosoma utsteinense]MBC3793529.1 DNA-binding XRE family transcriptional regulator [Spirosoma utsteinense]